MGRKPSEVYSDTASCMFARVSRHMRRYPAARASSLTNSVEVDYQPERTNFDQLRGAIESAGYRVATAVDGVEGYAALRSGEFDLLVSDVEMPRMDGFELTAKLRADKRLAELPVVLVTALGSREQRERGIEVGANAYLVKSSFEQSDLLEVVRRLL